MAVGVAAALKPASAQGLEDVSPSHGHAYAPGAGGRRGLVLG